MVRGFYQEHGPSPLLGISLGIWDTVIVWGSCEARVIGIGMREGFCKCEKYSHWRAKLSQLTTHLPLAFAEPNRTCCKTGLFSLGHLSCFSDGSGAHEICSPTKLCFFSPKHVPVLSMTAIPVSHLSCLPQHLWLLGGRDLKYRDSVNVAEEIFGTSFSQEV